MAWKPNLSQFEAAVLEQSDAAYNLARWLLRHDQDAEDVVQESCMKALRSYSSYRGGDFRAWFLSIVRTVSYSRLRRRQPLQCADSDDGLELGASLAADTNSYDPHRLAERAADAALVRHAIEQLPAVLREAIVLREMEGMSYRQIGAVVGVPIGTVMSRLARGREQLHAALAMTGVQEGPR